MLCAKCSLKNLGGGVGKCTGCGGLTYSRAFKFCGTCSEARKVCAACGVPGAPLVNTLVEGGEESTAADFYDSSLVLSSGLTEENQG